VLGLGDRERDGHLLHLAARVDALPGALGGGGGASGYLLEPLGDDPHRAEVAVVASDRGLDHDLAVRADRECPPGVLLADLQLDTRRRDVRGDALALRDKTRGPGSGGEFLRQVPVFERRRLKQRLVDERHEHDPHDRAALVVALAARVGGERGGAFLCCRLELLAGAAVADVGQPADDGEADVAGVAEAAVEAAALPAAGRPLQELQLLGLELAFLAQDEDRLPAPPRFVELLLGRAQPALLPRPIAQPDEQDEHVALGDAVEHTLEIVQIRTKGKAPLCGAFAEPSDGLEPSTPSLPF
jgi:hypothetical protein